MGLFWGKKDAPSESPKEPSADQLDLPADLSDYLDHKESPVSEREFKSFLKRQSQEEPQPEEIKAVQNEDPKIELEISPYISPDRPRPPPFHSKYSASETEVYRRNNSIREAALTNCSEIQYDFFQCLKKQSTLEKLKSLATADDRCTHILDHFDACMKMQKTALVMFDYASLDKVEEMEAAKFNADQCFSRNFGTGKDVEDDARYAKYTRELRESRERFYDKYGR